MLEDNTHSQLYKKFVEAIKRSISHSDAYLPFLKDSIVTTTFDGTRSNLLDTIKSIENDPALKPLPQEYCVHFLSDGLVKALGSNFPDVNSNSAFTITHYDYTILTIYHEGDSSLAKFDVICLEISDFFDELCEDLTAVEVSYLIISYPYLYPIYLF